jgi:hypothetical protein
MAIAPLDVLYVSKSDGTHTKLSIESLFEDGFIDYLDPSESTVPSSLAWGQLRPITDSTAGTAELYIGDSTGVARPLHLRQATFNSQFSAVPTSTFDAKVLAMASSNIESFLGDNGIANEGIGSGAIDFNTRVPSQSGFEWYTNATISNGPSDLPSAVFRSVCVFTLYYAANRYIEILFLGTGTGSEPDELHMWGRMNAIGVMSDWVRIATP